MRWCFRMPISTTAAIYLPSIVKSGCSGPIYTTPATIDLCNWMLRDTAHIHEKDAEFMNKRLVKHKSKAAPLTPL